MAKYKINGISAKKKNNLKFMILVIFLISVIMCISGFGLATWARYRTATGGNVTAEIAKWSFKVNKSSTEFAEIDLAKTIHYDHVVDTTIAPGTRGSFDLEIDGIGSEVSLDYYVDVSVQNKPTNMKFYSDSSYSAGKELQIVNNKIQLEDELLLTDKPMTKIETIYWDWEYRTNIEPEQDVLDNYVGVINGLQELVDEYNAVGITDARKTELILKMNDKIDTYEAGGEVILPVKVTGIQKYPEGFIVKSIYVTSQTENDYLIGETVTMSVEFSEGVYADGSKIVITDVTAPTLKIAFDELTTASNPIAKVATLMDSQIRMATGTERIATFVSVEKNKLNYEYTIQEGDIGSLKILELSGRVYNKKGAIINLEKKDLSGDTINIGQGRISRLVDVVEIGDYVNYDAGTYSISSTDYAGTALSGTMNTSEVKKWRVLSKNIETGEVELMAEEPTSTKLRLQYADGYRYSKDVLNKLCEIFGNGNGAVYSRSLKIEDILQFMDYDLTEDWNNSYSSTGKMGGTRVYNSGNFVVGDEWNFNDEIRQVVTGGIDNGNGTVDATSSNPVTVVNTNYHDINESTIKQALISKNGDNAEKIFDMFFKYNGKYIENCYLASNGIFLSNEACFYVNTITSGTLDNAGVYYSVGNTYSPTYAVRPVVKLQANIKTVGQNADNIWQLR